MFTIKLSFPAGRFHATPWGRNVNEGVVEWPPSPFRLARALIDVCKRRNPRWDDARLLEVIKIFETPPLFRLPPASVSHTRSFLSSNKKDTSKKQKIFDAFVVLKKQEQVLMFFDCQVPEQTRSDLNKLLSEMNYLGRSESWVKAEIINDQGSISPNCFPVSVSETQNKGELVRVACLQSRTEYDALSEHPVVKRGKGKKAVVEKLSFIEALSMSTKDLLNEGWSSPPALKMVDYFRPVKALDPQVYRRPQALSTRFTLAEYSLHSTVLPRVIDTVPFAEKIRSHLMGIHRKISGGDPMAVSPLFSGKGTSGNPAEGHKHSYILPLDKDGDGRLDHCIIKTSQPFDASELNAMDRLRSVWQSNGRPDVELVLVSLLANTAPQTSTRWVSATPFVISRHYRKGRGEYLEWLAQEVKKECNFHNLPTPSSIEWIDRTTVSGHQYRWLEFTRSRKEQKPMRGHGCILEFDKPISGPFAIGALAHFGLGLFMPVGMK